MLNESQKVEFVVAAAIQPLVDALKEVTVSTNFAIEPFRWMKENREHKKFHVFWLGQLKQDRIPCGSIEFLVLKAGQTMVRILPLLSNEPDEPARFDHLIRLFYLYVQRLVQLRLVEAP